MPLADMRDMLHHAYHNGYAVGSFELVSLDFLEAIIAAAERCRSPVILGLAESHFESYDFTLMMAAVERAARNCTVPVAIHLEHGASYTSAVRAINLGCNSVMVDASHEAFPVNVAQTRRVVDMAHACGVTVEGELGYVAGGEGENAAKHPGEVIYTSVEEAKAYVDRTGVDCLAVSIGTVHGRLRGRAKLDVERLKRINEALGLPLVLHGGSGLTEEQYHKLILHGIAKINCYTGLSDVAAKYIRTSAQTHAGGYLETMQGIRHVLQDHVERSMRLWGSAGRAAEVLMQCQPWLPVEHVIMYNAEGAADTQLEAIMARGREVLSTIPGVRRVFTGWAVAEQAQYRCCWLVEFAHAKVIESYRHHPDHVTFANQFFRPIAQDRISIDFVAVNRAPMQRAYSNTDAIASPVFSQ
ncbi:MAG: ketose-bisphosphate aldolase [Burkholderiales bacterium]|nr:ketose-bisphosphate aldolase [Burkholderiales bacterium]